MSWKATEWAARQRLGGPELKALLLALADYAAPDDQTCYPSQATLAWITEQGERTVRRQLAQLEQLGAISREKRYRPGRRGRTSDLIRLRVEVEIGDTRRPEPEENTGQDGRKTDLPATDPLFSGQTEVFTGQTGGHLPATVGQGTTRLEPPVVEPPVIEPDRFAEFYEQAYPRRVARAAAERAWAKALKAGADPQDIIDGALRYAQECKALGREDQFRAHPATWLNQQRWNDATVSVVKPAAPEAPRYIDVLEPAPPGLTTEQWYEWQAKARAKAAQEAQQ